MSVKPAVKKNPSPIILAIAAVCLLTFIVFIPSLANHFTNWDDEEHLINNLLVTHLDKESIKNIFQTTIFRTYIPLSILSFAVEYHFFGLNPFVYHLDNLLLHLGITALIIFLAWKMGLSLRASFLAGLLFGIHPMHVESVAWVTERKDVLYGFFYLCAFMFYWHYLEKRKFFFYGLTHLAAILSMLSKPMAVSLPLILLLFDWFYGRRDKEKMVVEKIPFFLYIISLALKTFSFNDDMFNPNPHGLQAALIFIWTATFYLQKFIWPFFLTPVYELPNPVNLSNVHYWIALTIVFAAGFCLYYFRKNKWVIFAFLFYVGSNFFLFRTGYVTQQGLVADRYMYISSLGFCLLFGFGIDRWLNQITREKRQIATAVVTCLLIALGIKTWTQCRIWKDSWSLWNAVIKHTTYLAFPYNNRGNVYLAQKQDELAKADYTQALKLNPQYPEAYANLGIIYKNQGNFPEALNYYERALKFKPEYVEVYFNRAILYSDLKKFDLALADINETLRINPHLYQGWNTRGQIYLAQNKFDLAMADFTQSLRLNPAYADGYISAGILEFKRKNYAKAIVQFSNAIKINQAAKAFYYRSKAYFLMGEFSRAWDDLFEAKTQGETIEVEYLNLLKKNLSGK